MAGYSDNREENYEIKYLRKVLGQVDERIEVPESVSAESLRSLLDNVEPLTPGEISRRRPRWLSLQSGIAYAAAFALIVALFYSMELYRPAMIDGGLKIEHTATAEPAAIQQPVGNDAATEQGEVTPLSVEDNAQGAYTATAQTTNAAGDSESVITIAPDTDEDAQGTQDKPEATSAIGGSARATLLYEDAENAYYYRLNDMTDPDRQSPVTLEIVNKSSQEMTASLNIADMRSIEKCIVYGDFILAVGNGDNGVAVHVYDNSPNPTAQKSFTQHGKLVDARLYKDVVHIVSLSPSQPEGVAVAGLPNATAQDTCIITAISLNSLETASKAYSGADGTVQLHNLNAYINYEGAAASGENGSAKRYIAQILFNGLDIELGTVS